MAKITKPVVQNGRLQLPSKGKRTSEVIPVGSADWLAWLQGHKRFVFVGENGRFTARKEMRRGQPYWYAYRRREGKLNKVYLGRAVDLTIACLQEADTKLAGVAQSRLQTPDDFTAIVAEQETAVVATTLDLIQTKFQPPTEPNYLLKRPHLVAQMNRPVTLLHAPSGFGKSTLLSAWIQASNRPVAWVTLDSFDDDPVRFCQLLFTAVSAKLPLAKQPPLRLLPNPSFAHIQDLLTGLINAITASELSPFALILDGYQFITNEMNHEAICFLIDHLPQKMQLFIGSDTQLPFSLSKWRAAGIFTEVTVSDLRLSIDEGIAFLQMHPATQALAHAEMRELVRQTNGWMAGLHLAAMAIKQQAAPLVSIGELIDETTYFDEFFVENVLQQQETAVQQFLLKTSILKRLTAELCAAVVGQENSAQLLDQLWRSNLFLNKLGGDPDWYQYHALFTAVLTQQLQRRYPDLVPDLHQRAARWYQQHDEPEEAVRHLLAIEAWEEAAALIESVALQELYEKGEDSRLLRWVLQLPVAVVQQHRSLLSTYIRLTNMALSPTHQLQFLDQVEANILKIPQDDRSVDETAVLQEVQSFQQRVKRGHLDVQTESEVAFGLTDDYLRGMQFFMQQDYAMAERLIAQELEIADANGNLFLTLLAGSGLAFTQLSQGRLRSSELIAQQILRDVVVRVGRLPEPSSPSFIVLAMVAYERNALSDAQKWVEKAMEIDPNPTSANVPMSSHVLQARIQAAQGNYKAAHATLKAAFSLDPDRRSMMWTTQDLMLWQAWILLREGKIREAELQLDLARLEGQQNTAVLRTKDLHLVILAEIQWARGEYEAVEETVTSLMQQFPHGFRLGSVVYPLTMLASTQLSQNKVNQAQKTMEKALRLAAPEGIIRPFLDHGTPILPLLTLINETGRLTAEAHHFTQTLVDVICTANALTMPPSATELATLTISASISERELEVLGFVREGLSNQAIALRMVVTVSTVNTHLKHIYDKLDVHTRTEAVLRAQELKLPL